MQISEVATERVLQNAYFKELTSGYCKMQIAKCELAIEEKTRLRDAPALRMVRPFLSQCNHHQQQWSICNLQFAICIAFTFALSVLGSGVSRAEEPTKSEEKAVTVPFELLRTKHMAVMIKINGKGPYRVIFDTGAPVTVLNNKIAKDSGLLKNVKRPAFSLFGAVGQEKVERLSVGDLEAKNVPVIIMDHPTVEAASKVLGPLEGIVGFPFFARYRMTLDYQKQTMTFIPNGFDPPDAMQAMMNMFMAGSSSKPEKQIIAPAAQWGIVVEKAEGDEEPGVTIKDVLPGSAAAAAGIQKKDRLLTLDSRWTDKVSECYNAAAHVRPGTVVKLTIKRGDKELELSVKPVAGL